VHEPAREPDVPVQRRRPEEPTPAPAPADRVLALQRSAGNQAVRAMLAREGETATTPAPAAGVTPPSPPVPATALTPEQEVEQAAPDAAADFNGAVAKLTETRLNELAADSAWVAKLKGLCSAPRFARLCAEMSLISKHAPRARAEAVRLMSIQLGDKDVAQRMMATTRTVIIPRDKQMTEIEEFRPLATSDSGSGPGKTFDGRQWAHVRGVGDVVVGSMHYAALAEENLLGGAPDAVVFGTPKDPDGAAIPGGSAGTAQGGYTPGYSTSTHEFAHLIHRQGLESADKATITSAYTAKRAATAARDTIATVQWVDGPRISPTAPASWVAAGYTDATWLDHVHGLGDVNRRPFECYASQTEEEYFAQNANAYLNTNMGTDATTGQPRNNTRAWVAANEPADLLALLDKLFQQGVANELESDGSLKASGTCTNPPPPPPPPPASP
jgi:hypothetical protein